MASAFVELDTGAQEALFHGLEKGDVKARRRPRPRNSSRCWWQNTVEGFLADPVYGGNRDFIGWKLIGFPGPRYNYVAEIEQYGEVMRSRA